VSGVIAVLCSLAVITTLILVADVDPTDFSRISVTAYVVAWPIYTAVYVGWGARVYSRLAPVSLRRVTAADDSDEQKPLSRFLGLTGTTNTTVSAAVVAVIVTILIAQRPEFRSDPLYILLTLLTVASSWVLMVFSFAQSYLRLGARADHDEHLRFHFAGTARFSDYFTLAAMISTTASAVPAEISSRRAWRVVRTNAIIAFVFNSVIIAMMVSLLFGGLLG
jgi:uncharacterized membrane protein